MNKFDMPTQLDAINFHNTHDTLSVPKGMTLKQLVEDYDRLNNIIDELERFLNYEIYCDFNKEMTKGYQDTLDKLKELKEGK